MRGYLHSLPVAVAMLLVVAAIYLTVREPDNLNRDVVLALIGTLVGALVTTASHSWDSYLDRHNQLRLAALDRRLDTHQQAYALWRGLIASVHSDQTVGAIVIQCQEWWDKNCLYLEPRAREAFRKAYMAASSHREYVKSRTDEALLRRNWKDIADAGTAIVEGVALPSLDAESKAANIRF